MKKVFQRIKKVDSHLIIALSAVVISICALYISVQEVRIMRTQQRLSMLPYITVSMGYNSYGFGIYLKNSGTGIAKIQNYRLFEKDRDFDNWLEAVKYLMPGDTTIGYNIVKTDSIQDRMIQPAEQVILFEVPWTDVTRKLETKIKTLDFQICYASLLEEYWVINRDGNQSVKQPCTE